MWKCEWPRRSSSYFSADSSYAELRVSQRPKFLPRDRPANKSGIIAKSFCDLSTRVMHHMRLTGSCLNKMHERDWIPWDTYLNSTHNLIYRNKVNIEKFEGETCSRFNSCFTFIALNSKIKIASFKNRDKTIIIDILCYEKRGICHNIKITIVKSKLAILKLFHHP